MNEFKRKLGIITLSFVLICFIQTAVWAITIPEIKSFVESLPLADFYNSDADIKISVLKELDAVSETMALRDLETDSALKAQLNQDAINNLGILRDRNSGCVAVGAPDEDDLLINNCVSQSTFYSQVSDLISQLEAN
jgi:hypothetical protein